MSCCGKKREELHQRRTMFVTPNPAPAASASPRTAIVFTGRGAYLVSGPHSREVYRFSSEEPVQMVERERRRGPDPQRPVSCNDLTCAEVFIERTWEPSRFSFTTGRCCSIGALA